MNDIIPPKKRPLSPSGLSQVPQSSPAQAVQQQPAVSEKPVMEPQSPQTPGLAEPMRKKHPVLKWIIAALVFVIVIIAALAIGAYTWYRHELEPVTPGSHQKVRMTVPSGMGPAAIGQLLKKEHLIHSTAGFDWYTRLTHTSNVLQAGTYSLGPGMSLPDIVSHLKDGKTDTVTITFLPGATVAQDKKVLKEAGYSQKEIDTAFGKDYQHPLFASKPASADLEGYIYGETYVFPASATVEDILTRTFDQFYGVVQQNDLVSYYKKRGLTLYQGITLASIIQREVAEPQDMKQVAQVFYLRLKQDMPLGSDVTYQYAADKMGVQRDPALESPYNTRIHKGLPPGPISAPGVDALQAVAHPAKGDYLFFLSGDDDKTYFAKTQAEHDRNIKDPCKVKCQIL